MPPKKRNSEVMVARGRLKGALQDIKGQDDDDQSEYVVNSSKTHSSNRGRPPKRIQLVSYDQNAALIPCRGRPPKRFKKESLPSSGTDLGHSDHKSFIMKLFDRSVDLAKYSENSALYPICRAWMLNQPRSNKLINFKLKQPEVPDLRLAQPTLVSEMKSGNITVINSMPACKEMCDLPRIPSAIKKESKDEEGIFDFNLDYKLSNPPYSRDALLAQLKASSTAVRKNWQNHNKAYQEDKFKTSLRVLEYIYKP